MPTYRITYWPPYDRKLIEDVDAEYADVEGEHRLVLRSWVIVVHEARLVVVRRLDLRFTLVEVHGRAVRRRCSALVGPGPPEAL